MKKTVLCITLILIMLLSGCIPHIEIPSPTPSPSPTPECDPYYAMLHTDTRPIAVMIDNDDDNARPQIGLEDAYLVYEIVVEGGATRYMALFKEHNAENIGPVRSSRHYFLDYAMENDAIYTHAGWSPRAMNDISSLGINNINGINGADGKNFWRDYTYDKTWHTLYTSLPKLWEYGTETKKYESTTDKRVFEYNLMETEPSETAESGLKLTIPYAGFYTVGFEYDSESKVYKRFYNGKDYLSQTGEVLTAKNIVVYTLDNYNLNDGDGKGRQDLVNIGEGEGYYLTNGKATKIKWSTDSRENPTKYTLEDGSELLLNPGNTYVQIVPTHRGYTIE